MSKIRILLVDDHAILREGLVAMLEHFSDMEVVGQAGNGQEALDMISTLDPDIAILDIAMPVLNGLEATRRIAAQYPRTRILVLTQHEEPQYVLPIIEAGASGFIPNWALGVDLINAIRIVARQNAFFYPSITETLANEIRKQQKGASTQHKALTPREKEILKHIVIGQTNAQIASELSLSVKTVEWHRLHLMEKLDLHHVVDLVHYAIKNGIIHEDDYHPGDQTDL